MLHTSIRRYPGGVWVEVWTQVRYEQGSATAPAFMPDSQASLCACAESSGEHHPDKHASWAEGWQGSSQPLVDSMSCCSQRPYAWGLCSAAAALCIQLSSILARRTCWALHRCSCPALHVSLGCKLWFWPCLSVVGPQPNSGCPSTPDPSRHQSSSRTIQPGSQKRQDRTLESLWVLAYWVQFAWLPKQHQGQLADALSGRSRREQALESCHWRALLLYACQKLRHRTSDGVANAMQLSKTKPQQPASKQP